MSISSSDVNSQKITFIVFSDNGDNNDDDHYDDHENAHEDDLDATENLITWDYEWVKNNRWWDIAHILVETFWWDIAHILVETLCTADEKTWIAAQL